MHIFSYYLKSTTLTVSSFKISLYSETNIALLKILVKIRCIVISLESCKFGLFYKISFQISRCKLSYIRWISNKVLLYSKWNYIQYPVINHNGKEYEKVYIYVYIYN